MKNVIILSIFFFCGLVTNGQGIYTPVNPTPYGSNNNRIKSIYVLGIPSKDTTVNTYDTSAQIFYRPADSSIWAWSLSRGFFRIGAGAQLGDIDVLQNVIDSSSFGIKKLDGTVKNVVIYADGLTGVGGGSSYTLPIASSSILGGIKIGPGLAINGSGVLSAYTNNNQLTNGANYTTISIADTRYQPLENQRLGKNNNVYFNKITTVPSGGDSVEIYGGVVIAHNSFGGYAALNHDSNGGIVTIENKNGFDGLISGKNITSPQLYFLPNTSNGIAGNTLPISVNGNFADVSGNITISTGGTYTLPTASATVLGGVKVGSGLAIDGSGVLSATGGGATPSLQVVSDVSDTTSKGLYSINIGQDRAGFFAFKRNTGGGYNGTAIENSNNAVGIVYYTNGSMQGIISGAYFVGATKYLQFPNISGNLAEGVTDGTTTVHAGTTGSINISSLLNKLQVTTISADPTTSDIPSGYTAVYRNSTSGLTYLWANISGTLIKVQLQ
jgi:hypothetical protein